MVYILHINDLHFVNNAADYNTIEILLHEAANKVKNIPLGEKLLIVTGDFHNYWDTDYQKAKMFLQQLVLVMGLDIKEDVFVIPGNHDVGNTSALEPLLRIKDKNWKSHQKSCLTMLKNGDMSYIEERLQMFLPYSEFVRRLGIYDVNLDENYPARSHVRCWRGKLNILHLNTALIADGILKDCQMTDVDTAADPKTWVNIYDEKIPSIAIGHCNFYDIKGDQRNDLASIFALRNVSAYLCGDSHQIDYNPEHQMISLEAGPKQDLVIPNLFTGESTADEDDTFSETAFCWHLWDEENDRVIVELHKSARITLGQTIPTGTKVNYSMRHEKPGDPDTESKPNSSQSALESPEFADKNKELRSYLLEVLKKERDRHPSFQLLRADEIDRRLYSNIIIYETFEPRGKVLVDSTGIDGGSCPVWKIVRDSWSAPEHRNVVITGGGGIGKTVALLSIVDVTDISLFVPSLYVPMYELVDQYGNILDLDKYIAKKYRRYSDRINILAMEAWNDCPRLLILLDGFNEIPFSLRRNALYAVNKWFNLHPGVQIIAVSRPMDGLNLVQELEGNPIPITLSPLEDNTVRAYLKDAKRKIPAKGSSIWEYLRYPLFLNLYVKTNRLKGKTAAGYPLYVMDAENGGSLIWNFLQRELLRHRADKTEKTENWILRCTVVNEYILPYIAYQMVATHRMHVSFDEVTNWTVEALDQLDSKRLPQHLSAVWRTYQLRHGSVPDKNMHQPNIWRDAVIQDSGILIPSVNENNAAENESVLNGNYVFINQHFRDYLAGLYLVNQAEMAREDEVPEAWRHGQNYLALDYVAELIDDKTADRLWEINRMMQQYGSPEYIKNPSSTFAILELQRRRKPLPNKLDFSGMDLRALSLVRYMGIGKSLMPLFQMQHLTRGTMLDEATFQSEGHSSDISCILILPDGRVVSGSNDRSLRVWDPLLGQCLQVLDGHQDGITCIAVLPDGRLVSGSDDWSLRIWNPTTGQCLHILRGHRGSVTCIAVLPDGRLVSGSDDHFLRIWDPMTGRCLQKLGGHYGWVTCIAVLPDGRLVSGSDDNSLRVWDPTTGQYLQILEGHQDGVTCIATLLDGRIVSGSHDGSLRVWDPSTGRCLQVLEGHQDGVTCIATLLDGRIVSGSYDRSLRVWDPSTGQCLQMLKGHRSSVNCIAVLFDERIVSGSYDGSLRVWAPSAGHCLQILEGYRDGVSCIAVHPDGHVIGGSYDHSLRVWDPSTGQCLMILERYRSIVTCIAVLPDDCVFSGSYGGTLHVWNAVTGQCRYVLEGHHSAVNCIAVLPDGFVVSGSYDRSLRVWDPSTGQCLQVLEGHQGFVTCIAVLPDGSVVSGSYDGSLRVWNPLVGQCLQTLKGHHDVVTCIVVLPDGCVVSGSYDGSLRVWDPSTGQCLQVLEGHQGFVTCIAVLPDGSVVSGSYDGSLRVWDPLTGLCLQVLDGHHDWIRCIAVLPDSRIVSGSYDGSLRIWDPSTGQCIRVLKGHHDSITYIAILSDSRIVSGSYDGSLRVWDPSTGQSMRVLERHRGSITYITILSNDRVVSGSYDGSLRVWDPNTGECNVEIILTAVDVSHMDLSSAILTKNLAKKLWHNGAKISEVDYQNYICCSSNK